MRKVLIAILFSFLISSAFAEAGYTQIGQETAKQMMEKDDGHVVVDVRRQDEYDEGHIPGAICVPNESIIFDSPEVLPDYEQIILVYCRSGRRSKEAAQKLASIGYKNIYEFGGIIDWTGEIVTTEEENAAKTAVLTFSSFSGGGYEYTVEIADPSIVLVESRYEYEPHADEIDGASYDFIVSLKGLKAGNTTVTVYGTSPIMEEEINVYTATVDAGLNVALIPVMTQEEEAGMKIFIGDTEVPVTWESNESIEALRDLFPLNIQMSMYGGFEQVGPIGQSIARNDQQTITIAGDIVLYAGNQIVVFYGSNSWAYTRLGHVNLSEQEMTDLLSHGDVTIMITGE